MNSNSYVASTKLTFLYFAYGSNLLAKRMHIKNPSAKFKGIAELKNYMLGFTGFSNLWKGAPATIVENANESVWGVVWELLKEEEHHLDKQEESYCQLNVTVDSPTLGIVKCKTYQLAHSGEYNTPSLIYKKVIIEGAKEHGLPKFYVDRLEAIKDNGYKGTPEQMQQLGIEL